MSQSLFRLASCFSTIFFTCFFVFAEELPQANFPSSPLLIEVDSIHSKPRLPKIPESKGDSQTQRERNPRTETVVVTGTRNETLLKDSPMRITVAGKEQTQNTAMVNAADLLREQTGALLQSNVRTGVQLMGLSPDYTLILIDGQPMVGRVAGVLDLSRISVGMVERVEVVKGPMSSLYGSEALAGVVNIITKKPSDGWSARAYSQYLQRGPAEFQGDLAYGDEDVRAKAYLNLKHSQPFELTQDGRTTPYSGFTDYTTSIGIQNQLTDHMRLSFDGRLFGSESKGKFVESFFGQAAVNEGSVRQNESSATLGSEWIYGKARLTAQLYGSAYTERYIFDTVQGNGSAEDDMLRRIVRAYSQYDVLWNEKNRFTIGVEHHIDDIGGARYPDKPFFSTTSLFGQWEGNPTSWISYSLSARYVKNSVYDNPSLSDNAALHLAWLTNPKFAVNFKVDDDFRIRGSVGTGYKVPDFRQLYVQFTNNLSGAGYQLVGARRIGLDLLPERSVAYDVGFAWETSIDQFLGKRPLRLSVDMSYFRNDLSELVDLIQIASADMLAVYSYRNIKRARTQGIEANIHTSLQLTSSSSASLSAGGQYLEADDLDAADQFQNRRAYLGSDGVERRLNPDDYGGLWFRSKYSGVMRLQYDHYDFGLTVNLRAQYIGKFGDQQLNANGVFPFAASGSALAVVVLDRPEEYAPGYTMLNFGIGKNIPLGGELFFTNMQISIGANNILNAMNLRSIPMLVGRQFFVNIAIEH